jgi:dihydrofolate reductase
MATEKLPIALVVARARNGVIGKAGAIPWRLSTDLKRFKALTMGKPVIMGRKTWDSLPFKPLPGRLNIVLTRDQSFEPKGAVACDSFAEALSMAREQAEEDGAAEICVIGGGEIYALALPRAARIYLTEVALEPEGDAVFPDPDPALWREVSREAHPAGDKDEAPFVIRVLERG